MRRKTKITKTPKATNEKQPKNIKLTPAERETHISYAMDETKAVICSAITKDINDMTKKGFTLLRVDKEFHFFECPRSCVSFRSVTRKPRSNKGKPLSEEHKQKMMDGRKRKENDGNNL